MGKIRTEGVGEVQEFVDIVSIVIVNILTSCQQAFISVTTPLDYRG